MKTPSAPWRATRLIRIAAMAPVGPEIWNEAPPRAPMMNPARIAVIRPLAASKPELTPKARASGRATAVTVSPARMSLDNLVTE